jgi:hypothetical protein
MVPVSRNASAITGRPHICFADLLAVASREAQGRPFALLNADLVLVSTTDLAARVAQLRPGKLVFSRRLDIDQPSHEGHRCPPLQDGKICLAFATSFLGRFR